MMALTLTDGNLFPIHEETDFVADSLQVTRCQSRNCPANGLGFENIGNMRHWIALSTTTNVVPVLDPLIEPMSMLLAYSRVSVQASLTRIREQRLVDNNLGSVHLLIGGMPPPDQLIV